MSETPQRVVIIGAGQAGGQAAYSLRQGGYDPVICSWSRAAAPKVEAARMARAEVEILIRDICFSSPVAKRVAARMATLRCSA